MSVKENIQVARKWNLEVINQNKVDALAEVLHPHNKINVITKLVQKENRN